MRYRIKITPKNLENLTLTDNKITVILLPVGTNLIMCLGILSILVIINSNDFQDHRVFPILLIL